MRQTLGRKCLAPHAHVPMPLRFTPADIARQQAERNAASWHRLAILSAVACVLLLVLR